MQQTAPRSGSTKVVVASTVALSFISFWKAASVVLGDLASSMFYAGGIAEQAIGRSAPWFVLGVMFLSFAVRSVYLESCSMFVRGGVYVVVRDSMGPVMARISVSALIFDYLLTGPISGVSAGQYAGRLLNEVLELVHIPPLINSNIFAVCFAIGVTAYFWWANIKGLHESSMKALRIMQVTTIMVVILLVWCPITLLLRGPAQIPPAPSLQNIQWGKDALGWFEGSPLAAVPAIAMVVAFGHAFLSLSGFETLAQVYREIAYPKLKNLRITANLVCSYAVISTGLITILAGMIIPDAVRNQYFDNLIGGLSMHLAGPEILRVLFHAFVVLVGASILSSAINTSLIGANSVLNRVAEDGVLLPWFRRPHPKFGTTHHMINMVAILQVVTILASQGDVYLLGEAYAFGVVWSFCIKSLGVLVLRFQRSDQEYKTPGNIRLFGKELPIGLALITLALFTVAIVNLISKQVATISGIGFTLGFFVLFTISDRLNRRTKERESSELEEFNLESQEEIGLKSVNLKPGGILVAVRDYHAISHLQWVFDTTKVRERNVGVMTVRPLRGEGEYELAREQYFSVYERELFTHVVHMAEKAGRQVELLVVPSNRPFEAIVSTAARLQASKVIIGASPHLATEELARRVGLAWESLPEPRPHFSLVIVRKDGQPLYIPLGPHAPRLWPEDVKAVHAMWLELTTAEGFGAKLHHRDVVSLALKRLKKDLAGGKRLEVLRELWREITRRIPPG